MPHLSPLSWVLSGGLVIFMCMMMIIFIWWGGTGVFSYTFKGAKVSSEQGWQWGYLGWLSSGKSL